MEEGKTDTWLIGLKRLNGTSGAQNEKRAPLTFLLKPRERQVHLQGINKTPQNRKQVEPFLHIHKECDSNSLT